VTGPETPWAGSEPSWDDPEPVHDEVWEDDASAAYNQSADGVGDGRHEQPRPGAWPGEMARPAGGPAFGGPAAGGPAGGPSSGGPGGSVGGTGEAGTGAAEASVAAALAGLEAVRDRPPGDQVAAFAAAQEALQATLARIDEH